MQETLNQKNSLEWALAYAARHTPPVPDEIKPHLQKIKSAPPEFDDCPVTRSVTAVLLSLSTGTLAVKASAGDFSLPLTRSYRSVRYRLGDIKAYLENNSYRADRKRLNENS